MTYSIPNIHEASDEELLFELIRRNGHEVAPSRVVRVANLFRETFVGVGKDHTAVITIESEALEKIEALAETKALRSVVRTGLSFGDAIRHLKLGTRVARAGWNGKGMWLAYVSAGAYDVGVKTMIGADDLLPWIGMKTADGKFVPWLASQTDVLAEDWVCVGGPV